jgi:hypothetical protein
MKKITIVIEDEGPQIFIIPKENNPCAFCPNNPKNGGSGICFCTLPYMSRGGFTYTWPNYSTTTGDSTVGK